MHKIFSSAIPEGDASSSAATANRLSPCQPRETTSHFHLLSLPQSQKELQTQADDTVVS